MCLKQLHTVLLVHRSIETFLKNEKIFSITIEHMTCPVGFSWVEISVKIIPNISRMDARSIGYNCHRNFNPVKALIFCTPLRFRSSQSRSGTSSFWMTSPRIIEKRNILKCGPMTFKYNLTIKQVLFENLIGGCQQGTDSDEPAVGWIIRIGILRYAYSLCIILNKKWLHGWKWQKCRTKFLQKINLNRALKPYIH